MELLLTEVPTNSKTNVWQDAVPILQTSKNRYDVYITEAISEPGTYDKLCFLLDNADENDHLYFHLNTPGGYLVSAWQLIDAMERTKAKITGLLTGEVASAGTIISMYCDELEIHKFTCFMIHNYSGGASGKAHEIEAKIKFDKENMPKFFKEVYKDFLTTREISKVLKGEDIYLNAEQVREKWKAKKGK